VKLAHDPATLAFYAAEATSYTSVRPDSVAPHLSAFLNRLLPGASILELGCGGGCDAEYMIERGFAVEPTDGVAEMAAHAEARLGRPVRVMRFDQLDAVERYEAVIANASLLHVPQVALADVLARIWRALKSGGWHLASYKTGGPAGSDEFGRYYNRPSRVQIEAIYREAGRWRTTEIEESFEPGHFGKPSAWLKIVARKAMTD
jgi:SAM-dependent methyltransferase